MSYCVSFCLSTTSELKKMVSFSILGMKVEEDNDDNYLVLGANKLTCFKISIYIIIRMIISPHVPTAQLQKLSGHLV